MRLQPFELERFQSLHEHSVEINLSESGVEPLTLRELLDSDDRLEALLDRPLEYVQTNGTRPLRAAIAALYPGAQIDEVQVTNGGSEANLLVCLGLVEPGDEVVLMLPNYLQTQGLVRGLGALVHPWPLRLDEADGRWRADPEELERLVGERTRAVLICNPNNPTGATLDAAELDRICGIADRHGAWVVSDEIYRGAEVDGVETPTVHGRYERVVVTSGLSKAYGLPGLRVGWIVGPAADVERFWRCRDYTTIANGALSDHLATFALDVARPRLLQRARDRIRANLGVVRAFLDERPDEFVYVPPRAGAILWAAYARDVPSVDLAERLRMEKDVLLVPGSHFDVEGHVRLGFGGDPVLLREGLSRIGDIFDQLPDG